LRHPWPYDSNPSGLDRPRDKAGVNEIADRLAGAACALPPSREKASYSAAKALAEKRFDDALQPYWAERAPTRYKELEITARGHLPMELSLDRPILARLLAARTGHGRLL